MGRVGKGADLAPVAVAEREAMSGEAAEPIKATAELDCTGRCLTSSLGAKAETRPPASARDLPTTFASIRPTQA